MRRTCGATAAAVVLLAGGLAAARPFTVDDLLGQASLGAHALDPTGRRLVFEQRDAYGTAERYDQHFAVVQTLARLRVVDVAGGPARPLLNGDPRGLALGPFSPGGTRLAVFDTRGGGWRLGVVTLATGAVRWFAITPQEVRRGRSLQWLSERDFLVLDRPDGWAPADLRQDRQVRERLAAAWAQSATGAGAHTVLGSGAYAGLRPRAAARRLLRVDAATGEVRELARGAFVDLEASPDGRRVALFSAGPDRQPRGDGPVRGPAGQETEATELSVREVATGRLVSACRACGDLLPNLLAWSPGQDELLAWTRGADGLWTSGRLLRVDVATGEAAELPGDLEPHATLNPVSIRAGWMGRTPLIHARMRGSARWGWLRWDGRAWRDLTRGLPAGRLDVLAVGPERLVLLADGQVVTLDAGGRARRLGAGSAALALRAFRGTPGSRLVNALPEASWVVRREGSGRALSRVSAAGPGRRVCLPGTGEVVAIAGAAAVTRSLADTGVERLDLVREGAARTVVTINGGLAGTDPPEPVAMRHRGASGEALTSWMFLPKRAAGAPAAPVIVRPYLGYSHAAPPRDLYMEQGFFQNLRLLTGHGYAVLVPSLPPPPEGLREPMAGVADRILAVMAAAEAEPALQGRFDPDRAAILGWSFGGYTTMAAITQTDRFRAAVAMDGISDLTAYWSALPLSRMLVPEDGYGTIGATGTVEQTQPRLGAPPWADPERYRRNSPLVFADRITTPLLLVHGALDPIAMSQSQAMYSALFRQGKDAQLVIYWGANHAVTAPGDVRDVWARTFAFLDAHLTPPTTGSPSARPGPASASDAPRPPPPRR